MSDRERERVQGLKDHMAEMELAVRDLTTVAECFSVMLDERPEMPIGHDIVKVELLALAEVTARLTALTVGEPDAKP